MTRKPIKNKGSEHLTRILAVWTGLEPATSCVTGRHSNQLNYHTIFLWCKYNISFHIGQHIAYYFLLATAIFVVFCLENKCTNTVCVLGKPGM